MKLDITNKIYNDEDAARAHLEEQLWPNGPVCPHCGSFNATKLDGKAHRKGLYQCNELMPRAIQRHGRHRFRALQDPAAQVGAGRASDGRQQEGHLVQADPAHAWRHLQDRVVHDHALARGDARSPDAAPIGGEGKIIESDETFVGGKKKNVHKGKPEPKKHAVHALVERGGEVRAKHVADVTAKTLRKTIVTQANRKSRTAHRRSADLLLAWARSSRSTRPSTTPRTSTFKDGAGVQSAESVLRHPEARRVTARSTAVSEQHLQRYVRRVRVPLEQPLIARRRGFRACRPAAQGCRGKRLTYRPTDEKTEPGQADA